MAKNTIVVDIAELENLVERATRQSNKHTNKRISQLEAKFDKHNKELLPYLEGLRFIKWLGGLAVAAIAFYTSIKVAFPQIKWPF